MGRYLELLMEKTGMGVGGTDRFKAVFKRYKKKDADLGDAIDFAKPSKQDKELIGLQDPVPVSSSDAAAQVGLTPPDQWKIYTLSSTPGLLVIPNPFQEGWQHYWIRRCLVDYPCTPNVCNLDAHVKREGLGRVWPEGGVWSEEGPAYRLRWVTLGYHYDWDTKEYYDDRKSQFPSDLAQLSSFVLEVAGFPRFVAEAAIVNFYHLDSTLSGHTDHSERDLSLPLLSISFGQSAVFLIGGESKSIHPQAILLHSGDVVIMSGPSRLAYHGVPKIISPVAAPLVPPALSRLSLVGSYAVQRSRSVRQAAGSMRCQACGRETSEVDIVRCTVESGRVQLPTSAVGGKQENCTLPRDLHEASPAKKPRVEKHDSSCSSDHHRIPAAGLQCWEELIREWPHFERYLSTSRINVNIRQVNSHIN